MTEGRLKCGYCESDMSTLWRGYIPLVDADGLACVSVVGEEMGKHAVDLKLGDQVVVTKLLRQGCPVRVVASNHTASTPAAVAAIKSPVDLKAWLLTVWKDEALASFFRQVAAGKLPDVITVITPHSEVSFDMTAIEAKDKALVAKRNAEYMARIAADRNKLPPTNTKPSKNGKHNKAN